MSGLANPRLMELQQKALAERQRRGEEGYNDEHVKHLAIYLTMTETDLAELTVADSLALAPVLGLSTTEYITAASWLDPEHASKLRKQPHASH